MFKKKTKICWKIQFKFKYTFFNQKFISYKYRWLCRLQNHNGCWFSFGTKSKRGIVRSHQSYLLNFFLYASFAFCKRLCAKGFFLNNCVCPRALALHEADGRTGTFMLIILIKFSVSFLIRCFFPPVDSWNKLLSPFDFRIFLWNFNWATTPHLTNFLFFNFVILTLSVDLVHKPPYFSISFVARTLAEMHLAFFASSAVCFLKSLWSSAFVRACFLSYTLVLTSGAFFMAKISQEFLSSSLIAYNHSEGLLVCHMMWVSIVWIRAAGLLLIKLSSLAMSLSEMTLLGGTLLAISWTFSEGE